MYAALAILFILGAFCGTLLRLLTFLIILLTVMAIAAVITWADGKGGVALSAIISGFILQMGYAAGIILRSLIVALQCRFKERITPGKGESMDHSSLP